MQSINPSSEYPCTLCTQRVSKRPLCEQLVIIDEEMLCKCVISLAILRLCFKVGCKMEDDDRVLEVML